MSVAFAISASALSFADTRYQVIDLGDLPGGYNSSGAFGISATNCVAGSSVITNNRTHGFYWDSSALMRDVGTIGGVAGFSYSYAVNRYGQTVGSSWQNGAMLAFVWDINTGMTALPGLLGGTGIASANAINDSGLIAGGSWNATEYHACLWDGGTYPVDLGALPGDTKSEALGIGPTGIVVGYSQGGTDQAFVWTPALGMVGIGQMTSGAATEAWAINGIGQVVGISYTTPARSFVWESGAGFTDLGDPVGGGTDVAAFAINNYGSVVGHYAGTGGYKGFVYEPTKGVRDINPMLAAGSTNWTIIDAEGINDRGWIAGSGKTPGMTYQHAVLLRPIRSIAPSQMTMKLGRLTAGSVTDLAADDGVAATVCKFLVPNQQSPFVRIEFTGACPPLTATDFSLQVKSKMVTAGSFRHYLTLLDYTTGTYNDTFSDALGLSYATVQLTAAQPSHMVSPTGEVKARYEISQNGPSASALPCALIDYVSWTIAD